MNTPKKAVNIIIISLLLIISITSIGFAIKYYKELESVDGISMKNQEVISHMQYRMDSAFQKSQADELFINGQYEAAMEEYEKIPEGEYKEQLISEREKIIKQMSEYQEGLQKRVKSAQNLAELNQNLLGLNLASARLSFESENDSLKTVYTNKIEALENLLLHKEQELMAKLDKAPKIGRLTFYNINGTKVDYFGEVLNGKANGQGIGKHATGSVYDGEWKDNLKHGKGTFRWVEGEVYEGQFVNGKREGEGTYVWNNGNKYEGEWQNDKRSGIGILYDKDNKVLFQGNWQKDEFAGAVN